MPSIKQLQNRLLSKKNSLSTVNLNLAKAEKSKNNIVLRRLNQEKGTLDRDIKKLERQLVTEKKAASEKKTLDSSPDHRETVS
jgi:hypothetical protein